MRLAGLVAVAAGLLACGGEGAPAGAPAGEAARPVPVEAPGPEVPAPEAPGPEVPASPAPRTEGVGPAGATGAPSTDEDAAAPAFREHRLVAADAAPYDHLGFAVAAGGGVVAAGARFADVAGTDSGAVYVFRRAAGAWRQEAKLVPGDAVEHDRFGTAVAVDGDTLLAGAQGHSHLGRTSGAAYLFTLRGGAWRQQARLAVEGAKTLGHAVALNGDLAAVGAPGDPVAGRPAGAVYLFRRQGSSWRQEARLTADDGEAHDLFGLAVALSGDTLLAGAPGDDEEGSLTGAAYVFQRHGGEWRQEAKLLAGDAYALAEFGKAVAIDGDTALVGAEGVGKAGAFHGAAYVFGRSEGAWRQEAKLLSADLATSDRFGNAVALHGDTAVVGARFADPAGLGSGAAYLFRRRADGWRQEAKLVPAGAAAGEEFGHAVGIHGATVVVGALRGAAAGPAAGVVVVFEAGGAAP